MVIRDRDRGSWAILRGRWFLRRVDPNRVRQEGRLGRLPHEALRVGGIGGHEHLSPSITHCVGPPVVYGGRRHQPDARVVMRAVYQEKNVGQKTRASSIEPNRSGNSGRYFSVLNWASEKGLSSLV